MRLLGRISGFEKCAQELVSHAIHHMESSPEGLHRNHNYINLLPWCAMDHVQWSARRHQTSHSRRRRRRRRRRKGRERQTDRQKKGYLSRFHFLFFLFLPPWKS